MHGSWKTWKVMEFNLFIISFSKPGKSWSFSVAHGKFCFMKSAK